MTTMWTYGIGRVVEADSKGRPRVIDSIPGEDLKTVVYSEALRALEEYRARNAGPFALCILNPRLPADAPQRTRAR